MGKPKNQTAEVANSSPANKFDVDYGYLARMSSVVDALKEALKLKSGCIVGKLVLSTPHGDKEIRANSLSSVCVEQIEQALTAEAERYAYRIEKYLAGDPDANALYKD